MPTRRGEGNFRGRLARRLSLLPALMPLTAEVLTILRYGRPRKCLRWEPRVEEEIHPAARCALFADVSRECFASKRPYLQRSLCTPDVNILDSSRPADSLRFPGDGDSGEDRPGRPGLRT